MLQYIGSKLLLLPILINETLEFAHSVSFIQEKDIGGWTERKEKKNKPTNQELKKKKKKKRITTCVCGKTLRCETEKTRAFDREFARAYTIALPICSLLYAMVMYYY